MIARCELERSYGCSRYTELSKAYLLVSKLLHAHVQGPGSVMERVD